MLTDGRILVVEYKGGHLYAGEEEKRRIGAVWADESGGECLFVVPTETRFEVIDRIIGPNLGSGATPVLPPCYPQICFWLS